jgi:hypothetical protein
MDGLKLPKNKFEEMKMFMLPFFKRYAHARLHSKRVGKMQNYTRNEWGRCKTTLETSGEDVKPHSKRVEKIQLFNLVRPWGQFVKFSKPSNKDELTKRLFINVNYYQVRSSPLVSSVNFNLFHSFRVYFFIFYARFECNF